MFKRLKMPKMGRSELIDCLCRLVNSDGGSDDESEDGSSEASDDSGAKVRLARLLLQEGHVKSAEQFKKMLEEHFDERDQVEELVYCVFPAWELVSPRQQ